MERRATMLTICAFSGGAGGFRRSCDSPASKTMSEAIRLPTAFMRRRVEGLATCDSGGARGFRRSCDFPASKRKPEVIRLPAAFMRRQKEMLASCVSGGPGGLRRCAAGEAEARSWEG